MIRNGVHIEDTFAEAFDMKATRIIITASSHAWAREAAVTMTGFATSVIACGIEAGLERELPPEETPDGRPGVAVLVFSMSGSALAKQLETRVGQCVLTAPGSAVFAGMEGEPVPLGQHLRFFGDGYQISKRIRGRRYWRIPVMDGEFLCEETTGRRPAIGGGNFLVLGASQPQVLAACEDAVAAMRALPNVVLPFPGGMVRSGSKIGSKYAALPASTNDAFCPTLQALVHGKLGPEVKSVLEIVVNGLSDEDIARAMRAGISAVCERGAEHGIFGISAGNYGGKLGPHHFHLHEIMA